MPEPLQESVSDTDRDTLNTLAKLQFAPPEAKRYITDLVAAEVSIPAGHVTGLGNLLPWLIDINVLPTAVSHTNWNTITTDTAAPYNRIKENSSTQNDQISFDVVLGAGTWSIELLHITTTNVGIYTIQLDDTTVGTVDGYSAALTYTVRTTVSGVIVAATSVKRLKLIVATKNASSTGYRGLLSHIQLRRTA